MESENTDNLSSREIRSVTVAQDPQWRFNITTADLVEGNRIGDNEDEIILTQSDDPCIEEDEVQFEIKFNIQTARWKAARLQKFDDIEYIKQLLEVDCRWCSHQTRFKYRDIVDYGLLVLWKDPILDPPLRRQNAWYLITDAVAYFKPGKKYTFDWVYDGAPIKK